MIERTNGRDPVHNAPSGPFPRPRFEEVEIGNVRIDLDAFRFRDTAADRRLVESVRRYGVLYPVDVEEYEGAYWCINGFRRIAAALEAGLETIPAFVYPELTEAQTVALNAIENIHRKPYAPEERATVAFALIHRGRRRDEIRELTGMDDTEIDAHFAVFQAEDSDLRKKVAFGEITLTEAVAAAARQQD